MCFPPRSFFSKSPAASKPKEKISGSSSHSNGNNKRLNDSSDEDAPQESKRSRANLSESPVLKGKGKRKLVILDSDDEGEEENGGVKDVQNGSVAHEPEGTHQEEVQSKAAVLTPPTSPTLQPEGGSAVKIPIPLRRTTGKINPFNLEHH